MGCLGVATVISTLTTALGAGVMVGVGFGDNLAGVAAGLGAAALALAIIQLLIGCTGVPPRFTESEVAAYRPSWGPLMLALFWGAALAQPLVGLAIGGMDSVTWVGQEVGSSAQGLAGQVRTAWNRPGAAAALSLTVMLVISAPAWLRIVGRSGVVALERMRWRQARALIVPAHKACRATVTAMLLQTDGGKFRELATELFVDAPFNREPHSPMWLNIERTRAAAARAAADPPPPTRAA